MRRLWVSIALSLIAWPGAVALGLEPAEVLVVANENVADSVALAKHYATVRDIPPENIALIRTTGGYSIARPDYEKEILTPIRAFLARRTSDTPIRVICLMWGVPVRIEHMDRLPPPGLPRFYTAEAWRYRQRLSIDRKLMVRIGKRFPKTPVKKLEPLAKLFDKPSPTPPSRSPALAKLRKNIEIELAQAIEIVAALTDEQKQHIAGRQLLGMHLELYGLEGLIAYVDKHHPAELPDATAYRQPLATANAKIAELTAGDGPQTPDQARTLLAWHQRAKGALATAAYALVQMARTSLKRGDKGDASVDSELAMIGVGDYKKEGPLANPLHFFIAAQLGPRATGVIMTCRIDGPTAADARRIIDDSVAVERLGLDGVIYVDAGMPPRFQNKEGGGYVEFDQGLRSLGVILKKVSRMRLVMDLQPTVFPADSCPNAALYVGWYSLQSYVPAFQWARGAVAYHVASYEAMDLRNPKSNQWCPKLIQNGVVATLGAVNEPGLAAFPDQKPFFLMLLTGRYTVAECYWRTTRMISWQMTLIADPLYNPFKVNPHVNPKSLKTSDPRTKLLPDSDWPPPYRPPTTQPAATQPASSRPTTTSQPTN
ncbi:hypothetical protein LCGC14_0238580 [marine sediment metagenome]|uniref:TIGR03790 family protein n=1 Tax=marine sediment metagenome TaxID=412755 RepID=A0A0F9UPE2_9ZZZZ|nr:TIGR03790 family protein [Phycisphaerae bacterium]HDZ42689.1 TIGR03790 family protein [Phycisphaerae bacterium]